MSSRNYLNTSPPTSLSASVSLSAVVLPVGSTANYPSPQFTLGIDRGTDKEEICLCTGVGPTSFTVSRGYDGTAQVEHDAGASVEHCVCAIDYREPNVHINNTAQDDHTQYLNETRHDVTARHAVGAVVPVALVGDITTSLPGDTAVAGSTGRAADGGHKHARESIATQLNAFFPAGVIFPYGGSSAPTGWLLCDGGVYSSTTYSALSSVLGTFYNTGGEGAGNFRVPDLRGRVLVGAGAGSGLTNRTRGQRFGVESVTLNSTQMPTHSHGLTDPTHTHGISDPGHAHTLGDGAVGLGSNQILVTSGASSVAFTNTDPSGQDITYTKIDNRQTGISVANAYTGQVVQNAGSGGSHENMPPSIVVSYIIKAH